MKIGILQTGRSPDSLRAAQGDYDGLFRRLLDGRDLTFDTYAVLDGEFPPGPNAADGWLITGSRHSAYEGLPWIAPLEQLIRQIIAADRPLVGICFGHQVIAQALGGQVVKHEGGWAVGPKTYQTSDGRSLALNAWHQDQVASRPNQARVLARNDFCPNAVLAYGQTALTFQAHPEFTTAFTTALLGARGDVLPPEVAMQAREDLAEAPEGDNMASTIAQFFQTRRIPF